MTLPRNGANCVTDQRTNWAGSLDLADELRLVRLAKQGEDCAFAELTRCFRARLVHLLERRTGCLADAEDVAQQALLRALQRIDQHDERRRFSVWLYRIAIRIAVDRHRKARPKTGLDPATMAELSDPHAADPEQAAVDGELRHNLWSVAQNVLSAEQYSALWLRYAEDLPVGDVARALGRSRVATRVFLHRARQRLAPHVATLAESGGCSAAAHASAKRGSRCSVVCRPGDVS